MENKPRFLTVYISCSRHPQIMLSGVWLRKYGFSKGDRVQVTSVEPGKMTIETVVPAEMMDHRKREKKLEALLADAEAELKKIKSNSPPVQAFNNQQLSYNKNAEMEKIVQDSALYADNSANINSN